MGEIELSFLFSFSLFFFLNDSFQIHSVDFSFHDIQTVGVGSLHPVLKCECQMEWFSAISVSLGIVDPEGSSGNLVAIQIPHGAHGGFLILEFAEAETLGPSSLPVIDDLKGNNRSDLTKNVLELIFTHGIRNITDVDG